MISTFLNRKQHDDLILFFNGWGMDHTRFVEWSCGPYDVLAVHDFAQLEPLPDLSGYKRLHLIAWSLGIWVSAKVIADAKDKYRFTTSLAINGTLNPIDAQDGIPPDIFDGTIENWEDVRAREKFGLRVSGTTEHLTMRSPDNQHAELVAMHQLIQASPQPPNIFSTALISTRDRIFPPAAQRHFWSRCEGVTIIEKPLIHDPFVDMHSWEVVLALAKT
jgi:biotin synthesis protein BioG